MAPKRKLSAIQCQEIEDLYAQNVSQADIGKKYGVSRHTIRNVLVDRGVRICMGPKRKLSAIQCQEIEDLHAQNVSLLDIGKKYGVSSPTIRNVLVKRGIRIRKRCSLPKDSCFISLKVPKETLKQLHIIAEKSGTSLSDVARGCIESAINQTQANKEYWEAYEATKKMMHGGDDY
jgi:predicted DNA-binding protein YlxM (UPF0122 family)/predicted DNA-binding protein